ncbi:MAG: hypothetical protein LBV17_00660 [Treponema sp.]|jgi:hypothetical protein|nr:hypothetical protein [Treponema sp.]
MKKIFLVILLCISLPVIAHAQESESTDGDAKPGTGFDYDIRLGFSFPIIGNFKELSGVNLPFASSLLAFAFVSISLGGGVQYTIVPHLLAPGIYADLHFNLFSWFLVGAFTNWEKNLMLLQPGIRFYNQLKLTDSFCLDPFFGINYIYMGLDNFRENVLLMAAGFVLKLGNSFGFEYCYNFPTRPIAEGWSPKIHRIGFSWSLKG